MRTGEDRPGGPAAPRRRLVVTIGIDDYQHLPKLRCAVSDAKGVEELLTRRFGFEAPIAALTNGAATKAAIEGLVEDQLRKLLEPDDALLLFFAGHGTTRVARLDEATVETGYLAPVEAAGTDRFGDLVNMEELLRKIGLLPARHILVVLDACHSGMALGSSVTQYRSTGRFLHRLVRNRSRRVITSARRDEVAMDSGPVPGHSLFTGTLISALASGEADLDGNGVVTFSELALFLQQRVGQSSGSRQTPDYGAFHMDDRGELVITGQPPADEAEDAEGGEDGRSEAGSAPAPARTRPARRAAPSLASFLAAAWFASAGCSVALALWCAYLGDIPGLLPFIALLGLGALSAALVVAWRKAPGALAARALERAVVKASEAPQDILPPSGVGAPETPGAALRAGLRALATSKLANGRRGAGALAELPWYIVLGPAGSGKTSLLSRSRLDFLHSGGKGIQSAGRLERCTWWLGTSAVFLETRGVAGAAPEDRERWTAFLTEINGIRARFGVRGAPVRGIFVTVGADDLLAGEEGRLDRIGAELRGQIDCIQAALGTKVPVSVLITKCDLMAGFAEHYDSLGPRALPGDEAAASPTGTLSHEISALLDRIPARVLRCMAAARSEAAREAFFRFAADLRAACTRISRLATPLFGSRRAERPAPVFRGLCFAGGERDGELVHELLSRVIWSDQRPVAGLPPAGRKLITAAALVLAFVLIRGALLSYEHDQALIEETAEISAAAGALRAGPRRSVLEDLDRLDPLRRHVEKLDGYLTHPPLLYGRLMSPAPLFRSARDLYVASLERVLLDRTVDHIEEVMASEPATNADRYRALRMYLLLIAPENGLSARESPGREPAWKEIRERESGWLTSELTEMCLESLPDDEALSKADQRARIEPHVRYFVDLARRDLVKRRDGDAALIDHTRQGLARMRGDGRIYSRLVESLASQKLDPLGPDTRENLAYPPVSLESLFRDNADVLGILKSAQRKKTGAYYEVPGPYTAKARRQVLRSLVLAGQDSSDWVMGHDPAAEERIHGARFPAMLDRVRSDYHRKYIEMWTELFRDITLEPPLSRSDRPWPTRRARNVFQALATPEPEWPYLMLLRALAAETRLEQSPDLGTSGGEADPVGARFRSALAFAGLPDGPVEGSALAKYIALVAALRSDLTARDDVHTNYPEYVRALGEVRGSAEEKLKQVRVLLLTMDSTGQEILGPLLEAPFLGAATVDRCWDWTPNKVFPPCRPEPAVPDARP